MGLFTSKTVVDISGKESTYKNPGVRSQDIDHRSSEATNGRVTRPVAQRGLEQPTQPDYLT